MAAYYNEFDGYAAQWLRNLIAAGHIAPGDVDERSIVDVRPDDLRGYRQCHFFAGLGGWPLALRLAGAPDSASVWTGSCPCQPFSSAGKRAGFSDDRHLWPVWRDLIRVGSPATVLGEQVAGATDWLRAVRGDLEALGYAVGAIPVEAASAGAFHRRDRFWFVANASGARLAQREREPRVLCEVGGAHQGQDAADDGRAGLVVDADGGRRQAGANDAPAGHWLTAAADGWHGFRWLQCADGKARPIGPGVPLLVDAVPAYASKLRAIGNAIDAQVAAEFIGAVMECRP